MTSPVYVTEPEPGISIYEEMILNLSGGNVSSISICQKLTVEENTKLGSNNLFHSRILCLYSDVCGEDIDKMKEIIKVMGTKSDTKFNYLRKRCQMTCDEIIDSLNS